MIAPSRSSRGVPAGQEYHSAARSKSRKKWRRWSGWLFAAPYLILFGTFLILPLVYGFGLSFFRWEMLSRVPPQFTGLGNYHEAFQDEYFWKALGATLRFVVMAVPFTLFWSLLLAMGVHAMPRKRQSLYRAAYFLPTILTISVVGILWRWFYNSEFGLFNAYLGQFGLKVPWITDTNFAMKSIVLMTLWWTVGGPMVVLLAMTGVSQVMAASTPMRPARGRGAPSRFNSTPKLAAVRCAPLVQVRV
jgi:multiple sugar transport system permease protein